MTWKEKIEQLAALLEKIPQPQSFEVSKGVYQPYFVLELRPANWEIVPYAEYTRLDGVQGKETRLTHQIIETQKVNINQDELNLISYLLSFNQYDTRRLFAYGQPVGFLLDWLRGSRVLNRAQGKELVPIDFAEDTGTIALGISKENEEYILQPIIVYPDRTVFLDEQIDVLAANPIYILHKNILYRVESRMSAFFWINFFRLQQRIRIPIEEIKEFINSFISRILPALDWKSLEEHLKIYELPLNSTRLYLQERAGQLHIEVKFLYQNIEFPAQPPSEKSLASEGKYLFIVKRDIQQETAVRRLLHQSGLLYIQHRWQVDPQYHILDWLREQVPLLVKQNIELFGEEKLYRYRLKSGTPRLKLKFSTSPDWLEMEYELVIGKESLTISNLEEQLQPGKRYLKLSDGTNIYFGEELVQRLSQFLRLINQQSSKGKEKFRPASFLLVDELIKLADTVETDQGFQQWVQHYQQFDHIQPVKLTNTFKGVLRDYQKTGLDWLAFLNQFRLGGILADDMGLGKTIQVIALLSYLKQKNQLTKPSLIVVPLTVLFNWESELKRFAPGLSVLVYQGQKAEREKLLKQFSKVQVVLVSYGILLQDQSMLQNVEWEYVVVDESQKIKNPQTKTYQTVEGLKSAYRLCLTGTPIENSVTDLWSQFNFLNPGMLGTLKQFEARFGKNGFVQENNHRLLQRIIHPFILRRRKEEVLEELPARTDITQLVEMTDTQRELYNLSLQNYREQIFSQLESNGLSKTRLKILEALTHLRQLACHPAIFDSSIEAMDSGKMILLEEMLEELIQEDHKVLVFSQFVRFLHIIQKILDEKQWTYSYLDGTTRDRKSVINKFQEDPEVKVFLISLKAGGLGLNLTAADYVIHMDPWWNPAVEEQATDRAHRIGQKNKVFVYKYIVKNTVEEKVLRLQEDKKKLSNTIITSEKSLVKELSIDDLKMIFQIPNGSLSDKTRK